MSTRQTPRAFILGYLYFSPYNGPVLSPLRLFIPVLASVFRFRGFYLNIFATLAQFSCSPISSANSKGYTDTHDYDTYTYICVSFVFSKCEQRGWMCRIVALTIFYLWIAKKLFDVFAFAFAFFERLLTRKSLPFFFYRRVRKRVATRSVTIRRRNFFFHDYFLASICIHFALICVHFWFYYSIHCTVKNRSKVWNQVFFPGNEESLKKLWKFIIIY